MCGRVGSGFYVTSYPYKGNFELGVAPVKPNLHINQGLPAFKVVNPSKCIRKPSYLCIYLHIVLKISTFSYVL